MCVGICTQLGRVFKDVPAPTNREMPRYRYVDSNLIVIGDVKPVA